mmetsp:Transcript_45564/g.138147  ORF Transcript_45564/g.138147 Transcript_45564/m.138147 type:complete len:255 (+) Transcript_45564:110-874(+)
MPRPHFEPHPAVDEATNQAPRAGGARREHATLEGQLLPVEPQSPGGLDGDPRGLVIAVAADEAALRLVAAGGLGVKEEAAPGVPHVLQGRTGAVPELPARALVQRLLLLQAHAVLAPALRRLVALGVTARHRDLLRGQHRVLREVQRHAPGPVAEVRLEHVRAAHRARVEEGVNVRRPPDAHLPILGHPGHGCVPVLIPGPRRDDARARLHIHDLEAVPVDPRDEAAEGERVRAQLFVAPVRRVQRGARPQRAS